MHAPHLSIGMTDDYFSDVEQKGQFMDVFTKYGNVKYVFSGHIHNGTKVSIRSARNYKGTNFIVCPTHIWAQRPFGKNQKYDEVLEQNSNGFIIGYLKGDSAELYSILPDETKFEYPDKFKKFSYVSNPLNFFPLNELPPAKEDHVPLGDPRLAGWYTNYVYL